MVIERRLPVEGDYHKLWEWRNDVAIRNACACGSIVPWKDFMDQVARKPPFVLWHAGIQVGYLTYSANSEINTHSIFFGIDKHLRRMGYGSAVMELLQREAEGSLHARVCPNLHIEHFLSAYHWRKIGEDNKMADFLWP